MVPGSEVIVGAEILDLDSGESWALFAAGAGVTVSDGSLSVTIYQVAG